MTTPATVSGDHPWDGSDDQEPLSEGATWLLDLIGAVDYLRRGILPGLTVWDAIAEALDCWTDEQATSGRPDPSQADARRADPLRAATSDWLAALDAFDSPKAAVTFQQAIRRWVTATAATFNAGYPWPHPTPRRSFPPSAAEALDATDEVASW